MERVGQIQAVPGLVVGKRDDIFGFWVDAHQIQNVRKRDSGPFGDERPAFFASLVSDLGANRHALQLRERESVGTSDHAAHGEPPIGKAASKETLRRARSPEDCR